MLEKARYRPQIAIKVLSHNKSPINKSSKPLQQRDLLDPPLRKSYSKQEFRRPVINRSKLPKGFFSIQKSKELTLEKGIGLNSPMSANIDYRKQLEPLFQKNPMIPLKLFLMDEDEKLNEKALTPNEIGHIKKANEKSASNSNNISEKALYSTSIENPFNEKAFISVIEKAPITSERNLSQGQTSSSNESSFKRKFLLNFEPRSIKYNELLPLQTLHRIPALSIEKLVLHVPTMKLFLLEEISFQSLILTELKETLNALCLKSENPLYLKVFNTYWNLQKGHLSLLKEYSGFSLTLEGLLGFTRTLNLRAFQDFAMKILSNSTRNGVFEPNNIYFDENARIKVSLTPELLLNASFNKEKALKKLLVTCLVGQELLKEESLCKLLLLRLPKTLSDLLKRVSQGEIGEKLTEHPLFQEENFNDGDVELKDLIRASSGWNRVLGEGKITMIYKGFSGIIKGLSKSQKKEIGELIKEENEGIEAISRVFGIEKAGFMERIKEILKE